MASDYMTMTPGSAVADKLQEILTQQRLEARQAMLDKLNRENVESEMSARVAQTENARKNQQLLAQNYDAAERQREFERGSSILGGFATGVENISDLPESVQKIMRERGLTSKATTTNGSIDLPEGVDPSKLSDDEIASYTSPGGTSSIEGFIGSPDFQKEAAAKARLAELSKNPGFSDKDAQLGLQLLMNGVTPPASMFEGEQPLVTIGPYGKTTVNENVRVPRSQRVIQLPMPPQAQRPQFVGLDQNDSPVNFNPDGSYSYGSVPPGMKLGGKPSASRGRTTNQAFVPPGVYKSYLDTFDVGNFRNPTEQMQSRWAARAGMVASLNPQITSPAARAFLVDIAGSLNRTEAAGKPLPSPEQIIATARQRIQGLTPADETAIIGVIQLLNPPEMQ